MTETAFNILLSQIKSGDKAGLGQVYDQTHKYCVLTLIKKTGCTKDDAEDLFMDAILVFREKAVAGGIRYLSNIKTYMFGICYNLWRDMNRSDKKWNTVKDEVERQYYLLKIDEPTEEEEIVRKKLRMVKNALAKLDEKCRMLLRYAYMEQRPQKEIADLMGFASANVVKVTRFRCYKKWMDLMNN
jgi:RNA polymerase sigma factor (sigma-70 family)